MGLDGFSMGTLGLNTDLSSVQIANQAEHLANKEFEIKIKDVDESAEEQALKRKEENPKQNQQEDEDSKEKDEDDEQSEEGLGLIDEKAFEIRDPKEFSVRINSRTEMIELFSKKDKRILETISAEDLMQLISKLDSASGILINRKI